MTQNDLTELQIEISELEKENQELRTRVKELEVNFSYVSQNLQKTQSQESPQQKKSIH
jgi:predicted  nucleic acid-binding Zn-ribbon protein